MARTALIILRISLLVAGGFFFSFLNAQTWSERFEFPIEGSANGAFSISELQGNYVVFQSGNPGALSPNGQHIGLLILDDEGQIVQQIDTGAVGVNFMAGWDSGISKLDNTVFMAATKNLIGGDANDDLLLIRYSGLEDDWEIEEFVSDYYHWGSSVHVTNAGDLLIIGTTDNTSNGSLGLIATLLSISGDLIWETIIPGIAGENGEDIFAANVAEGMEGEFIVTASKIFPGVFNQCVDNNFKTNRMVFKLTSEGEYVWELEWDNCYQDGPPNIVATQDGNFVLCYGEIDPDLSDPFIQYRKLQLIKINTDGDELWNKLYGSTQPSTFFRSIKELDDGSLIACGSYFMPGENFAGVMLKTTAAGDSLWMTMHQSEETSESKLYDLIQVENGFVACGYTKDDFGPDDTWVIKTDEEGCIIPNCHVGIDELGNEVRLRLYPNPAQYVANVEIATSLLSGPAELRIYDQQGRQLESRQLGYIISGVPFNYSLRLDAFSPGVYTMEVFIDNQRSSTEKLVVRN